MPSPIFLGGNEFLFYNNECNINKVNNNISHTNIDNNKKNKIGSNQTSNQISNQKINKNNLFNKSYFILLTIIVLFIFVIIILFISLYQEYHNLNSILFYD